MTALAKAADAWPFGDLKRGHYGAILADPPWRFATFSDKGRGRCPDGPLTRNQSRQNSPARHYQTMTLDEIRALPVGDLAAEDWGFKFKTVGFYWAKLRREASTRHLLHEAPDHKLFPMGTGYYTRANPELCLLFTRGNPKRISNAVRKLIIAPRREHSRKPDEARQRVEQLVAGPYVELFARTAAPGWDSWGDEVSKFQADA